jgi:hypothetical protein
MKLRLTLIGLATLMLSGCKSSLNIIVSNELDISRQDEMVETDAKIVTSHIGKQFVITDPFGQEVPYQITSDNKLIFQVSVPAKDKISYKVRSGLPAKVDTTCISVYRPDCQDDVAWENDHGGYRLYGPVYKRGGGKVYGYDIWCKSVATPVVNKFYDNHHHGLSYHIDHGEGFDGYTVGPTLGAGMSALVNSNKEICYQCAYKNYEVLDNGPLRVKLKFTIDSCVVDKDTVVETRIITLDKGSWLNRTVVNFANLTSRKQIVSGIVVHTDNSEYTIDKQHRYMSYVDLSDNINAGNGEIYVGVIGERCDSIFYQPFSEVIANATGQVLMSNSYIPGESYTYYWGSAWSKGGVESKDAWNNILRATAIKLASPLKIEIR